jgi:hypothetical protein
MAQRLNIFSRRVNVEIRSSHRGNGDLPSVRRKEKIIAERCLK